MSRRLDEERIQGFVLCQGFCYIKNIRINNVATKTTFLQKNIVSFKNPAPSENSAPLIVSPPPKPYCSPSFFQGKGTFYVLFEKVQYNIFAYSIIYMRYQKQ